MQASVRVLRPIPERLRNIPSPPDQLWIRGSLPPDTAAAVAIVGSRRPTAYGRRIATQIAGRLGAAGVTVVSGLAFGVDTIAHTAALEAGGRSVAILPDGLGDDDLSPQTNRRLALRIASRGALLSEYPEGTPVRKYHYEARNRMISGLADVVVVVEASRPSGTLITARHAGDQSRDVWAVPGPIDSEQSLGTNWLIDQLAHPLVSIDWFIDGFLNRYGTEGPATGRPGMIGLLSDTAVHFDELVSKSGKPAAEVEAELVKLELTGVVRDVGDRHYVLV
ncbi:MAG: DNA-processing protein DprA [bacterium]|nr:DNA-processing protein DprA [bacterium]MDZ4248394.1 DNA-processing protein DprA [Patescibacteria group bacterium]